MLARLAPYLLLGSMAGKAHEEEEFGTGSGGRLGNQIGSFLGA